MNDKRTFSETDIQLALDNEMPAEIRAEFDRWLAENPREKQRFEQFAADRDALKAALDPVLDEPVPSSLSGIRQSANDNSGAGSRWRMAAAAVLLLVAGGTVGYLAGIQPIEQSNEASFLADNALAAHVIYAAEKRHTVEVGADEKDHLVAWLSKRVGLSLVAPDLEGHGFSLVGGRLLPSRDRAAAQFMYENDAGERISLYVTTVEGKSETGFQLVEERGARAFYWLDHGYACAVTGSLPENELLKISRDAYRQLVSSDDW